MSFVVGLFTGILIAWTSLGLVSWYFFRYKPLSAQRRYERWRALHTEVTDDS